MNKLYKDIIANMGANFTESASFRAARAVSSLDKIAFSFDKQTGIHPEATAHSRRADKKDVKVVVDVLLKAKVLEVIEERCHSKFPDIAANPLHKLNRDRMFEWIKKKAKDYTKWNDSRPDSDCEDTEKDNDRVDEADY